MSSKLLPCPFCGSENLYSGENDLYCKNYIVYCYQCGCGTSADDETPEDAIKAWNARAERTCNVINKYATTVNRVIHGTCSICGKLLRGHLYNDGEEVWQNFCDRCGAKVIG